MGYVLHLTNAAHQRMLYYLARAVNSFVFVMSALAQHTQNDTSKVAIDLDEASDVLQAQRNFGSTWTNYVYTSDSKCGEISARDYLRLLHMKRSTSSLPFICSSCNYCDCPYRDHQPLSPIFGRPPPSKFIKYNNI